MQFLDWVAYGPIDWFLGRIVFDNMEERAEFEGDEVEDEDLEDWPRWDDIWRAWMED